MRLYKIGFIDPEIALKILIIYQFKKILFLLGKNTIFWLYNIFAKDLYRKRANKSDQRLIWILINIRHPSFSWICQFLLAFYLRF